MKVEKSVYVYQTNLNLCLSFIFWCLIVICWNYFRDLGEPSNNLNIQREFRTTTCDRHKLVDKYESAYYSHILRQEH